MNNVDRCPTCGSFPYRAKPDDARVERRQDFETWWAYYVGSDGDSSVSMDTIKVHVRAAWNAAASPSEERKHGCDCPPDDCTLRADCRKFTGRTQMIVTDAMVSRFLSWSLPKDFAPDGGISFTPLAHSWPIGTNVLDHAQARAMLEHVLADVTPGVGMQDTVPFVWMERALDEAGWANTLARTLREALAVGQIVGGSKTEAKRVADQFDAHRASNKIEPSPVAHPIQPEERCPKCEHDYALCNCDSASNVLQPKEGS